MSISTIAQTMPDDVIFALDIGTRTIVGLVGTPVEERLVIQAAEILEHSSRAMLDGQIHDITKVAAGAKKVKDALEKKLGYPLNKVSIAAAGRVLKTCQVKVERDLEEGREIDSQLVGAIEMEAIQKAQLQIDASRDEKEAHQFYCVGYSVVNYYLNDYVLSSLIGHKGHKVGAEILATFLPQMVVDSLYTVMERSGLEVTHLTLEPIAALNVAIPKDLRLLNLALVDIGAGTSDIAITKAGTVIAYAMVPVAGDELTETLAQHYLVDFNTAEKIKLSLSEKLPKIEFTDILDNVVAVSREEVEGVIEPVVDQLAKTISGKITEYNGGKPPNAIFLVGGGSQSPGLCEAIIRCTGLPKERVAVRNRSIAKNIDMEEDILKGPESITPFGILATTAISRGHDFFNVTVNGKSVKMYHSRKMTVSDALLLAGFSPDQLICKTGKHLKFRLNDKDRTIRGESGKPAEIYVNRQTASLSSFISPGDNLEIIPAQKGTDASVGVQELLEEFEPIKLNVMGKQYLALPRVWMNDDLVSVDNSIAEGSTVTVKYDRTIEEMVTQYQINLNSMTATVNGVSVPLDYVPVAGDVIECMSEDRETDTVKEPENQSGQEAILNFNTVLKAIEEVSSNQGGIHVTVNQKPLFLPSKATSYILVDIFNFIDFDLTNPKGVIKLLLNGKDAGYTDVIKPGDMIDIYWRE